MSDDLERYKVSQENKASKFNRTVETCSRKQGLILFWYSCTLFPIGIGMRQIHIRFRFIFRFIFVSYSETSLLEIFLSDVSETNPNTYPNRGYNDPDYIDFGRNLNHGYY